MKDIIVTTYLNIYYSHQKIRKMSREYYKIDSIKSYDIYKSNLNHKIYIHADDSSFALQCRLGSNKNILFCTGITRDLNSLQSDQFTKLFTVDASCGIPESSDNFVFYNYLNTFNCSDDFYLWDTCSLLQF